MNDLSLDALLYPSTESERHLAEDLRRDLGVDALFFVCVVEAALGDAPSLPLHQAHTARAA